MDLTQLNKEVSNVIYRIFINSRFYGVYLNAINRNWVEPPHQVTTMGVGLQDINYKLFINNLFWQSLTPDTRVGLLVHEVNHVMLNHISMAEDYDDPALFNKAADLYINTIIEEDSNLGTKCLPGRNITPDDYKQNIVPLYKALSDDLAAGNVTEEDYWIKFYQIPMRGIYQDDYPDFTNAEIHKGTPYIYNKMAKLKEEDDKNNGTISQLLDDLGIPQPQDHKDWKALQQLSGTMKKLVQTQTDYITKEIAKDCNSKSQGNIPNHLKGIIDKLFEIPAPIFDWKGAVKDWIGGYGSKVTIKRTRMKPNLIMKDMIRTKIKMQRTIAIATDTSGSVSQEEYVTFIQEALNIMKLTSCKIVMIECDAYVDKENGVYELKSLEQVKERLKTGLVTGGGGTSVDPVIEYMEERPDVTGLIYFTDGYLSKPTYLPHIPMLTVISSNGVDIEGFDWSTHLIKIPKDYADPNRLN